MVYKENGFERSPPRQRLNHKGLRLGVVADSGPLRVRHRGPWTGQIAVPNIKKGADARVLQVFFAPSGNQCIHKDGLKTKPTVRGVHHPKCITGNQGRGHVGAIETTSMLSVLVATTQRGQAPFSAHPRLRFRLPQILSNARQQSHGILGRRRVIGQSEPRSNPIEKNSRTLRARDSVPSKTCLLPFESQRSVDIFTSAVAMPKLPAHHARVNESDMNVLMHETEIFDPLGDNARVEHLRESIQHR